MTILLRHRLAQLPTESERKSPRGTGQVRPGRTVPTIHMTGSCPSVLNSALFLIRLGIEVRVFGLLVSPAGSSLASPSSCLPSDTEGFTPPSSLPNPRSLGKMYRGVGCRFINGSLGGTPKQQASRNLK